MSFDVGGTSPAPIALVDLDGTLADFSGAMRRDMAKLASPGDALWQDYAEDAKPAHILAREKLIKTQPGWWRSLDPLPLGMEVLDYLGELNFQRYILTAGPAKKPDAWKEKVEWGLKHCPDVPVIIGRAKHLVYGRVLVDDWPAYFLPWLGKHPRGLVVMHDQPWNRHIDLPRVVRLTAEALPEVKRRLKEAYDDIVAAIVTFDPGSAVRCIREKAGYPITLGHVYEVLDCKIENDVPYLELEEDDLGRGGCVVEASFFELDR